MASDDDMAPDPKRLIERVVASFALDPPTVGRVPSSDDADTVDAAISAALGQGPDEDWMALWDAVDALAGVTTFARWVGGDAVGTSVVDGVERPINQMPDPRYTDSVSRVSERLGALGLFVPFAWPAWDGLSRYRDDSAAMVEASTGDAVRLLTAIHRSGASAKAASKAPLETGVMQAALDRLRRWYDHERIARRAHRADE